MSKRRKLLLVLVSIPLVLIAAAGVLVNVEIPVPRLERALSARAEEILGMPVAAGALSVRLSRGARMEDVSIGKPGREIFTAGGITIECNFLEMLKRSLTVHSLVIDRPVITLSEDGAIPPLVFPAQAVDEQTGMRFSLASMRVSSGQVKLRMPDNDKPRARVIVDRFSLEAGAKSPGAPVELAFEASALGAVEIAASGRVSVQEEMLVDLDSRITVDWEKIGEALAALDAVPGITPGGKGRTTFNARTSGRLPVLNVAFSADASEAEIDFGGQFLKQAGLRMSLSGEAVLSPQAVAIQNAVLEMGESSASLKGEIMPASGSVLLECSADLKADEFAGMVPALGRTRMGGTANIRASYARHPGRPAEAAGRGSIRDWKFNYFAGDSLSFDFALAGERVELTNIQGRIGEGTLTGHGFIIPGGEYRFSLEGADIDLEKLLDIRLDEEKTFNMTGNARVSAGMRGKAGGFEHINGEGNVRADGGFIGAMPWIENYLSMVNLSGLMPFEYEDIKADFTMKSGVLEANARIKGRDAIIKTDGAMADLIQDKKRVKADFMLAPRLVERQRAAFREFDSFFYIDSSGYAHMSVVWDGPLAETRPNLAASLLETGMRRLLSR